MFAVLAEVGREFRLPGEIYSFKTITQGNINTTYKVTYMNEDGSLKSYLFQKINIHVFKNPVQIMENIDKVTTFIRDKYPEQIALHFHHTHSGENYYVINDDAFWRVVNYVDSITFNSYYPPISSGMEIFDLNNTDLLVYVPEDAIEDYKNNSAFAYLQLIGFN